jgi:hypothetical protein
MSEPTEAQRQAAQRILDTASLLDMGGAIAAALAAERARGRAELAAKVEALAEEWLRDGTGQAARDRNGISDEAWLKLVAADRLRALLADTEGA